MFGKAAMAESCAATLAGAKAPTALTTRALQLQHLCLMRIFMLLLLESQIAASAPYEEEARSVAGKSNWH